MSRGNATQSGYEGSTPAASGGGGGMGFDPLGIVSGVLDLGGGIASAIMARNAYKHRYQDEVKDLRAAGLNPALAYGASPGIPPTTTLPDVGSSVMRGQASALQAKMAQAQINKTNQETEYLKQSMPDRLALAGAMPGYTAAKAGEASARGEAIGLEALPLQDPGVQEARVKMYTQQLANLVSQGKETDARALLEKLTVPQKQAIATLLRSVMPFLKSSAGGMERLFSLLGVDK